MNEQTSFVDYQVTTTLTKIVRPLAYLAMTICFSVHLREFLSHDYLPRYDVDSPFLLLLLCFVVLQEARLWARGFDAYWENTMPLRTLVMGWWLFYLGTLAAASHVFIYKLPIGLLSLCVWVTVIYLGTLTSHLLYEKAGGSKGLMQSLNKGFHSLEAQHSHDEAETRQKHVA